MNRVANPSWIARETYISNKISTNFGISFEARKNKKIKIRELTREQYWFSGGSMAPSARKEKKTDQNREKFVEIQWEMVLCVSTSAIVLLPSNSLAWRSSSTASSVASNRLHNIIFCVHNKHSWLGVSCWDLGFMCMDKHTKGTHRNSYDFRILHKRRNSFALKIIGYVVWCDVGVGVCRCLLVAQCRT